MAPDNPKLWKNQADIYQTLQNHEQIIKSLERVVALDSNDAEAHAMLLHTTMQLCDWTDFGSRCGQVKKQLHSASIGGPLILVAMPEINRADMRQAARHFSRSLPAIGGRMACSGRAYVHERIKLAYLSADFFNHATAYLMAEVFELHDKTAFEVYGLSYFNDKASPMRTRLENAFEHFIDISTWSDGQVAQWMREHEIDIAVDLKGFTARCRFGIFKYKAVPIQVNYLGYPGTLGDECMDYIIGDSWVTPMAHQADYPEKIVQMPHSYQPNDRKRVIDDVTPSRAELGLPEDAFVFCCFNKNYKITPDVLDVWCDILKNVDNGVLWLFTSSQTAQNNLMREVELRGVAAQRLVFAQKAPLAQHLARHRCADLFLDTWPCNAHTTASDALWAGLPVLTCTGETFASRVAASLLDAVGLPELIVHHPSDYREAAIALAQDTQGLATLRQRLAEALRQSPLFDAPLYTRHLEAAYRTMWYRQQQGLVPAAFAVKDVLLSDSKNIRPIDD
jgi:predicted O-linked N-acetylglucosamine transferase (SPINDLY family)